MTAVETAFVEFDDVHLEFATEHGVMPVVDKLDLSVPAHSFTAIIGPSGCGKTTILNMLADVLKPSGGTITVNGEHPGQGDTRAGYLLARDALLPWRDVQANVELPLEILGSYSKKERAKVATDLLTRVGLAGFEHHNIKAISHGMRQRVSLARILAFDPEILLMDEPFSALDAQTRMHAQEFFLEVWQRDQKTVFLVTHDIQEALFMADTVLVFGPRPTKIIGRFDIDIPRPRRIEDLRTDNRFNEMYEQIWDLLKNDVQY